MAADVLLPRISVAWVWLIIATLLFWWTRRALVPLVLLAGAVVFHALVLFALYMGATVTTGLLVIAGVLALMTMAVTVYLLWCW